MVLGQVALCCAAPRVPVPAQKGLFQSAVRRVTTVSIVNAGGKGEKNIAESPYSASRSADTSEENTPRAARDGFVVWLTSILQIVANLEGAWLMFHINDKLGSADGGGWKPSVHAGHEARSQR